MAPAASLSLVVHVGRDAFQLGSDHLGMVPAGELRLIGKEAQTRLQSDTMASIYHVLGSGEV